MSTQCTTPFGVKHRLTGETIPVPCGKCPNCLRRRVSAWSFRLMQEEKFCSSALFITLTYSTAHVPLTPNGFMSITKRDPQLFFKRLRKAHPKGTQIRYYLCGEYGSDTKRPHYHAIIFNAQVSLIQDAWALGSVHYGTVTAASVGYCLKYMCKPRIIPMHARDDRQPEFALMSKKSGHLISV